MSKFRDYCTCNQPWDGVIVFCIITCSRLGSGTEFRGQKKTDKKCEVAHGGYQEGDMSNTSSTTGATIRVAKKLAKKTRARELPNNYGFSPINDILGCGRYPPTSATQPLQRSPLPQYAQLADRCVPPPNFTRKTWVCIRIKGLPASVFFRRAFLGTTAAHEAGHACLLVMAASLLVQTLYSSKRPRKASGALASNHTPVSIRLLGVQNNSAGGEGRTTRSQMSFWSLPRKGTCHHLLHKPKTNAHEMHATPTLKPWYFFRGNRGKN